MSEWTVSSGGTEEADRWADDVAAWIPMCVQYSASLRTETEALRKPAKMAKLITLAVQR